MKKLGCSLAIGVAFIFIYLLLNNIANGWLEKNIPDAIFSFILIILVFTITDKIFPRKSSGKRKNLPLNRKRVVLISLSTLVVSSLFLFSYINNIISISNDIICNFAQTFSSLVICASILVLVLSISKTCREGWKK